MSRSGYSEDCENNWSLICWRGAVARAIRGKRGQAFLSELLAALDAMENKRLISDELAQEGEVCAIGSVGVTRGIDMSKLDPEDYAAVAVAFGISTALAQEIMFMNDEAFWRPTPEQRHVKMRQWVAEQISRRPDPTPTPSSEPV